MNREIPIIIPAYEPDERLIKLLDDFYEANVTHVIIVNDGSNDSYDEIFNEAEKKIQGIQGCVLNHDSNKGKGRALKTGFEYVIENYPNAIGVVTADSDGQHTVNCIKSVSASLSENEESFIMGVRCFDKEDIPWKSRFGNKITIQVMKYLAGISVSDTQTGLRGIPMSFMKQLLDVKGERFEFEANMLLESYRKYPIVEVPIETIYDSKENHQTHFDPVRDSIKIYAILGKRFLLYVFSSLSSSVIDIVLFALLCWLFKEKSINYIAISTIIARIVSATYNYTINYKKVFSGNESFLGSVVKYVLLAIVQAGCSAFFATLFVKGLGIYPEVVVKIPVDTALFFISYKIQQKFVFNR